jgi:hypothetical protein
MFIFGVYSTACRVGRLHSNSSISQLPSAVMKWRKESLLKGCRSLPGGSIQLIPYAFGPASTSNLMRHGIQWLTAVSESHCLPCEG